jgi:predicted nucleotidyltransferase
MMTYQLSEFGLREKDMEFLISLLRQNVNIEKAGIFVSRAVGNNSRGSDVDLVLYGENLTLREALLIHYKLENESPTLLFFDVVVFHKLKNKILREEITRDMKIIYTRTP